MNDSPHLLKQGLKDSMAFLLLSLMLDDGAMGYAYVAMPADKAPEFLKTYAGKQVEWPDYATILYQNEGDYPPGEIRDWFYDTYGIES